MNMYFGDAKDALYPNKYNDNFRKQLFELDALATCKKEMNLQHVVFLHQVHGADGVVVTKDQSVTMQSFEKDGDYLLTKVPQLGLGIFTADCLPIVLYDGVNHAIGIVHAGWRGSVQHIACNAVEHMKRAFGTNVKNIRVFFGPSAKVCCFAVSNDFVQHLNAYSFTRRVLHRRANGLYFDLPEYNRLLLCSVGVEERAINLDYNRCTIEDEAFFSYRRQKEKAGRQMTVVSIESAF